MNSEVFIRPAEVADVPHINAILTHYALNTVMTFATEAQTDEELGKKLISITRDNNLPFLVASEAEDGTTSESVVGIAYISPWRPERLAYLHTGEMSLFVHHKHQGKGLGSALLNALLEAAKSTRVKELLAVMAIDDKGKGAGLALRDYYVQRGFREVGTMKRVGFKFGRWIDVMFLQRHIDE